MKLITLNAWQGRLFRGFVPFFEQQQADLICLQELNSSVEPIGDWLETFQGLQSIQKASDLDNQYFSPTYSYDMMGVEVNYGNGILSRYDLSDQQTVFTHGSYTKITKAYDHVHNTRNAQIVTVNSSSSNLTLVNTHAHWEMDPMGSELSLKRLQKLIEVLSQIKGPLIVAGDFNLKSESQAIQLFKTKLQLKDLTMDNNIPNTLNNLVTPYKVACDHIFVSEHVEVSGFKLDETLLSDHKALILEFDIKN